MTLKLQSKNIPQNPGVYMHKNLKGVALYIGKASNLRARLKSYFAKNQNSLKTAALIKEAKKLSWEIANSEAEALIRESELIKKWKPKYNILMRDDKQYLYVGFTKEKYSRIFVTHQTQGIDANYIGPFTESGTLKTVLKMLRRIFPYCTCRGLHKTPCLNSKIGKCFGFCCLHEDVKFSSQRILSPKRAGSQSESAGRNPERARWGERGKREDNLMAEYQNNIKAIKKILTGKNKSLLKSLKKEMKALSKSQRYEEARKVRDQIYALEKIFEHRKVIKKDMLSDRSRALHVLDNLLKIKNISRIEGYDISNIHGVYAYGSMVVFIDGLPKTDLYRIFKIRPNLGVGHLSNDLAMVYEVISRRLIHSEWPYPDVMLIDGGPTQLAAARKAYRASLGGETAKLIKIVSIAKREEELYLSPRQKPIKIKISSESLYSLLTHIRNESHRFAIKYYRKAHRKHLSSNQ